MGRLVTLLRQGLPSGGATQLSGGVCPGWGGGQLRLLTAPCLGVPGTGCSPAGDLPRGWKRGSSWTGLALGCPESQGAGQLLPRANGPCVQPHWDTCPVLRHGAAPAQAGQRVALSPGRGRVAGSPPEPCPSRSGVILYAMVSGKLPFKERQPHKMLRMIKQGLSFPQPISPGESSSSASLLPDLDSPPKPAEGAAQESASSARDIFPERAEPEAKAPELISAGCPRQLPLSGQAERPTRVSLYRPCLLSGLRPLQHLPNFRKPGSATSYAGSRRLGEKSPGGAAARGSSSSKGVTSLHALSPPNPVPH
ncbi:uncharacterized protein LOC142008367 [Carettochelys insculpta]|uniref:uncharacterized protein LOC142008367 n=1 Tax=Carettochelys insculpta TaxID=44489 RepID=UPI003EB6EDEE